MRIHARCVTQRMASITQLHYNYHYTTTLQLPLYYYITTSIILLHYNYHYTTTLQLHYNYITTTSPAIVLVCGIHYTTILPVNTTLLPVNTTSVWHPLNYFITSNITALLRLLLEIKSPLVTPGGVSSARTASAPPCVTVSVPVSPSSCVPRSLGMAGAISGTNLDGSQTSPFRTAAALAFHICFFCMVCVVCVFVFVCVCVCVHIQTHAKSFT